MSLKRRQREAVKHFRSQVMTQAPFKTPYTGLTAYAIMLGVPVHRAIELGYAPLRNPGVIFAEVLKSIEAERRF